MKDVFELVMIVIFVLLSFILGIIMGSSRIQDACEKLNSFYIDNKVYECKLK